MASSPISVLHFSNERVRGGAEEHMLTLLRGLDRKRFRLSLVCPPETVEKLRPDFPSDVHVMPLYLGWPLCWAGVRGFARFLHAQRVDILHSHQFGASIFASPIGKICGVPLIVETPHVREHWRKRWLKTRAVVDRLAGRFVDRYIAVSEANARYLVEGKRLPSRKVSVIHNGSALNRFDPRLPVPLGLKRSLGFGDDDPILMVLGRLEPQKGHAVLLEALPLVLAKFPMVRLVCVGEGSLRAELVRRVRQLNLESAVRFTGYQSNVPDWLALADVTVLPSFYEGLPIAAIESLAAGKPMVATAVDGTPEIIVDGKTGLTVPPGDSGRLGEAICRMLADSIGRQEMARTGREWVLRDFRHEDQIRKTENLYEEGLAQRKGSETVWRPGNPKREVELGAISPISENSSKLQ